MLLYLRNMCTNSPLGASKSIISHFEIFLDSFSSCLQHEIRQENGDTEEIIKLQTYSSFGEVSFLCNMPQTSMVQTYEFCKVLRLDKQSFTDILKLYFVDGRVIFNNLLEVCLLWIFFFQKLSSLLLASF